MDDSRKTVLNNLWTAKWYANKVASEIEEAIQLFIDDERDVDGLETTTKQVDNMSRQALQHTRKALHEAQTNHEKKPIDETPTEIVIGDRPNLEDTGGRPDIFLTREEYASQGVYWDAVSPHSHNVRGRRSVLEKFGLLIHWSMGSSMSSTMAWGKAKGFHFGGIKKDGTIVVPHNYRHGDWGYHAGRTRHATLGSGPSNKLIGVENDCAGLAKYEATTDGWHPAWHYPGWNFDKPLLPNRSPMFNDDQVRGPHNYYQYNLKKGVAFVKFTPDQERANFELATKLAWYFPETFDIDMIVGHDELAGYRGKRDPGGSMSVSMSDFRAQIKQNVADLKRYHGIA